MSWVGQTWRIRSRISVSDWRSAIVTKSASPLYSTATWRRKCSMSSAPASRAISDAFGIMSFCREGEIIKLKLLAFTAILRDVHDFMFEDEEIGLVFAGQPHHVLVVIFDPAADHLAIRQLDADRFLLLAQRLEIGCFFRGFFWRGRLRSSRCTR